MTTTSILLLKVALVVFTTVCHVSANDNRIETCENLLGDVGFFFPGLTKGFANFNFAYKQLTPGGIETKIDEIEGNAVNLEKCGLQKILAVAYFKYLLNGINMPPLFILPDDWCIDKVTRLRNKGCIQNDPAGDPALFNNQVAECCSYIVGLLFSPEDYAQGKMEMFRTIYENWSQQKFREYNTQLFKEGKVPQISLVKQYSLAYFNHIADYYVDNNKIHKKIRFPSIREFCFAMAHHLLRQNDDE